MRNKHDPWRGVAGSEEVKRREAVLERFRKVVERGGVKEQYRSKRPRRGEMNLARSSAEGFLLNELRLAFWRGYEAGRDVSELEAKTEQRKAEKAERRADYERKSKNQA